MITARGTLTSSARRSAGRWQQWQTSFGCGAWELGERFAGWLADGGHIVLAGLLPEQSDALAAFYLRWFDMNQATEQDGWVLVTGTRRARAD